MAKRTHMLFKYPRAGKMIRGEIVEKSLKRAKAVVRIESRTFPVGMRYYYFGLKRICVRGKCEWRSVREKTSERLALDWYERAE